MGTNHVEEQKVQEVSGHIAGAASVLHRYGIDPNSRLTIAQAASSVGAEADEVLAVVEYRTRRVRVRDNDLVGS